MINNLYLLTDLSNHVLREKVLISRTSPLAIMNLLTKTNMANLMRFVFSFA